MTDQSAKRDSRWITVVLFAILCLSRGYVAYQFGKLERIARTFLAGRSHRGIIAWLGMEGIGPSTASDFKLTHYQVSEAGCDRARGHIIHWQTAMLRLLILTVEVSDIMVTAQRK